MLPLAARRHRFITLAILAVAAGTAGCASTSPRADTTSAAEAGDNDPWEPLNRKVFAFNQAVDGAVIKPVAKGYRAALPQELRDRIRSVIDNLHEPLIAANDLLQGRAGASATSLGRFVVNSTAGFLGLYDKATDFGLMRQSGDFGQTLYTWGLGEGPYLVLPLLGPSNVRDAVGLGVDGYVSPVGHIGSGTIRIESGLSTGLTDGIDLRSRHIESLEQLEAGSLDFYAFLRSITQQNRRSTLRNAAGRTDPDELVDPGAAPTHGDGALPINTVPATPGDGAGRGRAAP